MSRFVKDIKLIIDGEETRHWSQWEVESDMIAPADSWSCSIPIVESNIDWAAAIREGMTVKVVLDNGLYLNGAVDSRDYSSSGLTITGRDNFLHIVDSDAEPGTKKNVTLITLARDLTTPWGMDWTVDQSITLKQHKSIKIEPGEKIIDVLQRIAIKEKLLLWCSADGTGMIGRPDYDQGPSYKLRLYHPRSKRQNENNILPGWSVSHTWDNRYKTITVSGNSGNSADAWGRTSHRRYVGTDNDLSAARNLIITDGDLKTLEQAKERAELKISEQVMESTTVSVEVEGHYGAMDNNLEPEIWVTGKLASVLIEPAGLNELMLLTSRRLIMDNSPRTALTLKPIGWMA